MSKIESLEGKSIALVGLGISQVDFAIGLQNGRTWDEVWCINSAASTYPCDRIFMLDPASRFFDSNDAGKQTSVMCRVLEQTQTPVYTCELDPRINNPVLYPVEDVCNATKCAYLNNTVAYAIAYALYNKVGRLDLFGIDFSYKENMHFAEAGRACVEFWISKCMSEDILIGISGRSTVLDSNVPATEKLYGFHRLDKPLVAVPHEGRFIIGPYEDINKQLAKFGLKIDEDVVPPEPYKG
ncbi:MAG: hypothetical protein VYC40_04135 [Pseudomonadota bacterium]|nr:hypothetical protein [Pseudomonadota bacterium]|tara:strand:- start:156 stop:875 length:720 start_codon:yes stop_codon:yes gene_type:complete